MKELKEINLGTNVISLKDNQVKTSILPKTTAELNQTIKVDGNVIAEGAIYANILETSTGPATFMGAVFANSELHIQNDSEDSVYFEKAVASANSIVALLTKSFCIFGADINSPSVKLKNCFVSGSIYGTDIQLENTIVLGGVFASTKLSIQNCIIGTFNAPEVNLGGENSLLYPTAFSVEPISALPGTKLFNLALADLGSLFKGESEKQNTGKIEMDFVHDTQRTVLTDANGATTLVNSYSVAGRILVSDLVDFEKFENHFLIISASLGTQILKQCSLSLANGDKGKLLSVQNIAAFFFDILSGKITIQEISGAVQFDELKKKYAE